MLMLNGNATELQEGDLVKLNFDERTLQFLRKDDVLNIDWNGRTKTTWDELCPPQIFTRTTHAGRARGLYPRFLRTESSCGLYVLHKVA